MEAIGGRWNLILLYWLGQGTRRFNEPQRLAPSISHKVLTSTLRQLKADGLVERTVFKREDVVLPLEDRIHDQGGADVRDDQDQLQERPEEDPVVGAAVRDVAGEAVEDGLKEEKRRDRRGER